MRWINTFILSTPDAMKTLAILSELNVTPPGEHHWKSYRSIKADKYDGNKVYAYNRHGMIYGNAGDWMTAAGADRSHIALAMKEARKSIEYERLLNLGMQESTNKREAVNGTFSFSGIYGELLADDPGNIPGWNKIYKRILISGKLQSGARDYEGKIHTSRLKSDAPATIETHPDLSPVERLTLNYTRAFKRLYDVQRPKFINAFKKRIKDTR